MTIYPGTGTADGVSGDMSCFCPSYIVTREDIQHIAPPLPVVVTEFFAHLCEWTVLGLPGIYVITAIRMGYGWVAFCAFDLLSTFHFN